jgi:Fe-Mn family superoxide dismutase
MKLSIKYENQDIKKHKDFVSKFIKLLQKEYPLKKDLKIIFMDGKRGDMSTGSRRGDNLIKVLAKGRLNRDIMRTLAHEWVHEYQMTILNRKQGPNIGGQNEDEANAFAGRLVKMFEKEHPELEKIMYENKSIEGRINLLSEQILLTEKQLLKESLLVEMKKIGIEKLSYSYSSLQRFIDSKTMNIHYNKHYKGYVDKLNKSIKDKKGDMDLEEIIKSISKFDDGVRNNAGGAFNHALFWKMLSPKKQLPKGEILKKIKEDFGNIKKLKDEFNKAAQDRFGSGWAWLYLSKDGKLKIMSTPNQDNPLMNVVKGGGYPLLGLDVWEHAYYLKYQNKRDEYISKFWDVVNWEFVNDLYVSKTTKKKLNESRKINEIALKRDSKIDHLCIQSKSNESPYCMLKEFRDNLEDDYLVTELERSIFVLDQFFDMKNVGTFPEIINLALKDKSRTVNFLELISDFIVDKRYSDDQVKKILTKQRRSNKIPEDIEGLLAYARQKEHSKYEDRFSGDYFGKKQTKLQLDYKCSDNAKETLMDMLRKVNSGEEALDYTFFQITSCMSKSFKYGKYYLKADLITKQDLKDGEGNVLYPSGSHFEVKKMDPFIDSYLSEFFSIFKQGSLSGEKPIYINLYNKLIDKIFVWLNTKPLAQEYIEKVKSQMSGIIYENDLIVPIEYIDLYWSNKGQRGCDEKRLSIRFRIKPEFNKINGFYFRDKNILEPVTLDVTTKEREKIVCPTYTN